MAAKVTRLLSDKAQRAERLDNTPTSLRDPRRSMVDMLIRIRFSPPHPRLTDTIFLRTPTTRRGRSRLLGTRRRAESTLLVIRPRGQGFQEVLRLPSARTTCQVRPQHRTMALEASRRVSRTLPGRVGGDTVGLGAAKIHCAPNTTQLKAGPGRWPNRARARGPPEPVC
jgi:hypothetical protein